MSVKQLRSVGLALTRKHAIWSGAVSAGKTVSSLVAFLIAITAVPEGEMIVIVGKTLQTIERNILDVLTSRRIFGPIADLTLHTRGSSIVMILGREVHLIGASNVIAEDKIRGATIALAYVDEIVLLPVAFWRMLLTRLRVTVDGVNVSHLLGTTNPASKNHWLRLEWMLRPTETNTVSFYFTMDDNPSMPEADKQLNRDMYSGLFYDRMILGKWTNAEGAVYEGWDPDLNEIEWDNIPAIRDIYCTGTDHGTTNPTSSIMLGITAEPLPRLIMLDEWRHDPRANNGRRLTNAEQSVEWRRWLRQSHTPGIDLLKPRFHFVDPAAADFREQLKRDGVNTHRADNAVSEGIGDVASLISQRRLLVAKPMAVGTPGCQGWLDEVTEYAWDAKASLKSGTDEVVKINDHSMDAGRYAVRSTRSLWMPAMQAAYRLAA